MNSITDQRILHIVNDKATAKCLAEVGLGGDILVWQDALYEGPVSSDEIDKLAVLRAQYFAARDYGSYAQIEQAYLRRNTLLKSFMSYNEVVLWFDHDLFGQLQLAQLLAWFNAQDTGRVLISLIQLALLTAGRITPRLSQVSLPQLTQLFHARTEVTAQQATIYQAAWNALTSNTPERLTAFCPKDMSNVPFIKNAFTRLAQEYPSKATGLSRTEYLIIDAVKSKNTTIESIFAYVQQKEPVAFMSKSIFEHHLQCLVNAKHPALQVQTLKQETVLEIDNEESQSESTVAIENTIVTDYAINVTRYTNQVFNKWIDWVQVNGINRWIGGVHLNEGVIWRYDPVSRQLHKTYV